MPLWLSSNPLVLASKSAARRAMLEAAGIPIEIMIANIDERGIESRAAPASASEAAQLLAREKAKAIATKRPGRFVVGADQTLALGRARFTKPADRAAAYEQLRTLSGRTHELHSAVAVGRDGRIIYTHVDVAKLTMRALSDRFLDNYLDAAGDSVRQSVGGYQLEKLGAQLFERIEGDYFTILGLPLLPLLAFLRREGCLAG
jgi:septum formation protein